MTLTNTWIYRDELTSSLTNSSLDGYDVEATDGSIGSIDKHSSETALGHLIVDTGFWIFGKKRLIPAGVVTQINHDSKKVFVGMTKDQIKNAPDYDDKGGADHLESSRDLNTGYYGPYSW